MSGTSQDFELMVQELFRNPMEFPKLFEASSEIFALRGLHGETLLHYMAVEEQTDAVRVLLALGFDPNVINKLGTTPLIDAATLGNFEIVKVLIEYGAKLDTRSKTGATALHYAAEFGHKELCDFLIKSGANSDLLNDLSEKPMNLFEDGLPE